MTDSGGNDFEVFRAQTGSLHHLVAGGRTACGREVLSRWKRVGCRLWRDDDWHRCPRCARAVTGRTVNVR